MKPDDANTPVRRNILSYKGLAPGRNRALKPLVFGLPVTILFLGIYEFLHWRLAEENNPTLHLLHAASGIILLLLITAIIICCIVNGSPRFLPDEDEDHLTAAQRTLTESERAKTYARWFIAMRWIAILLASALVIISVRILHWLPDEVWLPLVGVLAALAGSNVVYSVLVHSERSVAPVLAFQGYIDLPILTLLLHYSGGIENPLSMMMIFHIVIGGVLLSRRQCYWLAAAGTALFALMAWAEWADAIEHYTLLLYPHFTDPNGEMFHPAHHPLYACIRVILLGTVLFLTAYFVTSLADRLRRNERRLAAMADRALAGQQLLERALETTGTALRVLGADGRTYWTNARWQEWFGGPSVNPALRSMTVDAVGTPALQTLGDGQTRHTEVIVAHGSAGGAEHRADRTYVFRVTTAPLSESGGKNRQVAELAQDVTKEKQAQAQLVRAGQLAGVGELAGQVAHEVNNPIAIISAKSRLLVANHRKEMSPKIESELNKITELADRVARIAQGLLSYSRSAPAAPERLDVRQPVRKCLALVDQHARTSGVMVCDDMPGTLPAVNANPQELEQVFLNLVINALDAMPEGGQLRITASLTVLATGGAGVAVQVADTGVGILPAIRDRIFEPFFTTKQDGRGTGLGLSIGLGLIRGMGGDIEVTSEPEKGSCFTVKLPAYAARKETSHV